LLLHEKSESGLNDKNQDHRNISSRTDK